MMTLTEKRAHLERHEAALIRLLNGDSLAVPTLTAEQHEAILEILALVQTMLRDLK